MTGSLERTLSMLLTVTAIVIAGTLVHREFFTNPLAAAGKAGVAPDYIENWKEVLDDGHRVGSATAPVKIVEFADLECPGCRIFQNIAREVIESHPGEVSLVYVHYPLPQHRFSMQAARAAECAAKQGKFSEFADAVYAHQDSIGLKSWGGFARIAGIADTAAIARCAIDPTPVPQIEAGRQFGDRIALRGTPSIIINGWRLGHTPTASELGKLVSTMKDGKVPFATRAE
jgi:protein-disulfide isomerase